MKNTKKGKLGAKKLEKKVPLTVNPHAFIPKNG